MSSIVHICGAQQGSAAWNAGNTMFQQGVANNNPSEELLGSVVMNGWNGDGAELWGALASFGAMTLNLPATVVGAAGLVVSFVTGGIEAALDPTQGGKCPSNTGWSGSVADISQMINQAFYNLTGMSPMQWTASNGAYSDTQGSSTSSITAIVGGYMPSGRQ